MKKSNIFSRGKLKKVNSNYFTGKVAVKEISNIIKSLENKVYHVTFENGARTKLHYHEGGQILTVTKGKGSLVLYRKTGTKKSNFKISITKKIILGIGDIVYIPAKTLHTHGSVDKNRTFSHVAINASPTKNKEPMTVWFESDFKTKAMKII